MRAQCWYTVFKPARVPLGVPPLGAAWCVPALNIQCANRWDVNKLDLEICEDPEAVRDAGNLVMQCIHDEQEKHGTAYNRCTSH